MDYSRYNREKLVEMLIALEKDYTNIKSAFDDQSALLQSLSGSHEHSHELFKAFVDENRDSLVLIDTAYEISYVNRSAADLLQLKSPEDLTGRKVFSLMRFKDALKLKDMVDQSYLNGKKEKLKGLKIINPDRRTVKVKVTALRVRFNDQPAVRLKLKPD